MKEILGFLFACTLIISARGYHKPLIADNIRSDSVKHNSVDPLIVGAQVGIIGIWAYAEYGLLPSFALRGELGFNVPLLQSNFYGSNISLAMPTFAVEPKWYYNLDKRASWYKDITYNSGDFLSLRINYYAGWGAVSSQRNTNFASSITIVPTWGMRRNIGERFNVELAFGVGYGYIFVANADFVGKRGDVAFNLQIRAGYRLGNIFRRGKKHTITDTN